mmetsp:Transcript_15755/g.51584  ORF Transcript_15755/g.51584 Transcript_15755/m.51584 type:complete len:284 (-) Transcript_15755:69-920(-)
MTRKPRSLPPARMSDWMAAPRATASSGWRDGLTLRPVMRRRKRPMHGMRVAPPTSTIRSMGAEAGAAPAPAPAPASAPSSSRRPARCQRHETRRCQRRVRCGASEGSPLARVPKSVERVTPAVDATSRIAGTSRSSSGRQMASNLRRERVTLRPSGPCSRGTHTSTDVAAERATLASSAASSSRRRAKPERRPRRTAPPCSARNCAASQSATASSQSLPPSRGSPAVATTRTKSTIPPPPSPPMSTIETSNVPPPKSKTMSRSRGGADAPDGPRRWLLRASRA